ncbi:MAG: polysaccharide biosynthesis C-terminal domain-containing protein [bacterium]|nr:polysaccharide biosynthesis C-terminal domain-containing protein [bacterium]
MNIAQKILSNTAIQVFGKLVTAVISVLIIKAITSLEEVPGFEGLPAEYKLIYTYLMFFGILADFGLFTIAVREMSHADNAKDQEFVLGNIFGMRLFTILLAMTLASGAVFLIPLENYTWNVKVGVVIAAITTVFTMLASTTSSILQVKLKMGWPTLAIVLGKVVMAAYIIWTVSHFSTLPNAFFHLIYAGVFGSALTFLVTFLTTRSVFPFTPRFNLHFWKKIFKEAAPYGIALVLGTMYFKVDVLLLSFFRGKHEIAIYGYPSNIIEMLLVVPIYFMNCALPTLSQAFRQGEERVRRILSLSFHLLSLISFPIVVGGMLLARPLMNLVMNERFLTGNVPGYYGADLAFQLLLPALLLAFFTTLFSFSLVAQGKQGRLLWINLWGVLFNITTNLLFIPAFGFIAAGVTTILSEALVLWLTYCEARPQHSPTRETTTTLKLILAAVIMGVFVWMINPHAPILITVGIGALVFSLSLFPLRVFDEELLKTARSGGGWINNGRSGGT